MEKQVKIAFIEDEWGRSQGDYGYRVYYVPGDERWILCDNAGVTFTNFNIDDYRHDSPEMDTEIERLEMEISSVLWVDVGDVCEGVGAEEEEIMKVWGWPISWKD